MDEPAGGVELAPGVVVSADALRFAYARSSGPGGQNVNKVASKTELRVSVDQLPVSQRVRARLVKLAGRRVVGAGAEDQGAGGGEGGEPAAAGELVIVSQSERSQARNRAECLAKLRDLLVRAMAEPKVRRRTRPTKGSKERRLTEKRVRGEIKRRRRGGGGGRDGGEG